MDGMMNEEDSIWLANCFICWQIIELGPIKICTCGQQRQNDNPRQPDNKKTKRENVDCKTIVNKWHLSCHRQHQQMIIRYYNNYYYCYKRRGLSHLYLSIYSTCSMWGEKLWSRTIAGSQRMETKNWQWTHKTWVRITI